VFVPVDADPLVLERLEELGALVTACPRTPGVPGDPTVLRLQQALAEGALPFTCQGNLNGLAVEGGETLAFEIVSAGEPIDRLIVQVGGGALASACSHGFRDAHALGACDPRPRLDTVQTEAAWPLKRAFDAVLAHAAPGALLYASHHRSEFMWPWEQEPHSVAHGILDDETYDWLAVVDAMLTTGGTALVVGESTLERANALAREATGIAVDPTGSSGLAGLLALREAGDVGDEERVALLFTGVSRSDVNDDKGRRHEELSRTRHPVAQGL
jgi:threonine synthase